MLDVRSVARRGRACVLNWDQNKSVILQLYVIEDKPLPEVCDIMRDIHGFDATYVIGLNLKSSC